MCGHAFKDASGRTAVAAESQQQSQVPWPVRGILVSADQVWAAQLQPSSRDAWKLGVKEIKMT
jgi:hypothetical protein